MPIDPPYEEEARIVDKVRAVSARADPDWLAGAPGEDHRQRLDAEYKMSELRWRAAIEHDIKELVRQENVRREKYDAFIDKLILAEEIRAKFQTAVIEKSVITLLVTAVTAAGFLMWAGVKAYLSELTKR